MDLGYDSFLTLLALAILVSVVVAGILRVTHPMRAGDSVNHIANMIHFVMSINRMLTRWMLPFP